MAKEKAVPENQPETQAGLIDESAPKPKKVYIFESREKEPHMFDCNGISSVRNFSNGHLEWEVEEDQVELFKQHFFCVSGRIVPKAV